MEKFVVADYVDKFSCKCGKCRSCCCEGWPVTISYSEYCNLIGMDCSSELRKKIDCAFSIVPKPTMDYYARISKNYFGDCPLRSTDGFCMLQQELGAEKLPEICKMYPRNYKYGILMEGACANSCERVLELLFESENKLNFYETDLVVSGVKYIKPEISEFCKNVQKNTIDILQDRSIPLNKRIERVGEYLKQYDKGDVPMVKTKTLFRLLFALEKFSPNFAKFSQEARNNYNIVDINYSQEEFLAKYRKFQSHFESELPSWEVYLEKLLINHLFFIRFPYTINGEKLWDEYIAFLGIYHLTKLVCIGYFADKTKLEDFIDVVAGIYRCFEHSEIDYVIDDILNCSLKSDREELEFCCK